MASTRRNTSTGIHTRTAVLEPTYRSPIQSHLSADRVRVVSVSSVSSVSSTALSGPASPRSHASPVPALNSSGARSIRAPMAKPQPRLLSAGGSSKVHPVSASTSFSARAYEKQSTSGSANGTARPAPVSSQQSASPGSTSHVKPPSKAGMLPRKPSLRRQRSARPVAARVFIKVFGSAFTADPVLKDPRAQVAARELGLTKAYMKKLKAKFDSVDIDGSGTIGVEEFFELIGEQRSPLTDAVLRAMDIDGNGSVHFEEFVRTLCTFCMFNKEEILRFCFACFDKDNSGQIDDKEFMTLCRTVNNEAPMFPGNFQSALEQFDVNADGLISFEEFVEIDRRYPLILFPAFRLQDRMQRESLGEAAWVRIMAYREKLRRIAEYKSKHGGQLPPESATERLLQTCIPCVFKPMAYYDAINTATEQMAAQEAKYTWKI